MMTFKQFLGSQDDNISDEEAMKRYNDYKTDFRKQQIKEFFLQHKDEDWYGLAYQMYITFVMYTYKGLIWCIIFSSDLLRTTLDLAYCLRKLCVALQAVNTGTWTHHTISSISLCFDKPTEIPSY